jgi:hypothetical protein
MEGSLLKCARNVQKGCLLVLVVVAPTVTREVDSVVGAVAAVVTVAVVVAGVSQNK